MPRPNQPLSIAEDNSLIQKEFMVMMRKNKMHRFCFSLACFVLAGVPMLAADASAVRTTVRVDRSSGRLVRTQVILPKEVPPMEVFAKEVPPTPSVSAPKSVSGSRTNVDEMVEHSANQHGVDPVLAKS